ncbi:MAG: hypothetical protein A4E39_00094 [Methanoregulaceae archaeon PtaB.Bin152]|nr:MAG: hypothetical protein A4E39_00094 [Methanoregulaceae archaeon PtaB.Bin152]
MTMVLPDPVAILLQILLNVPSSHGTVMPTLSDSGASVSQMRVSIASSWQKKNRRSSRSDGSFQYWSNWRVMPVRPGYVAGWY